MSKALRRHRKTRIIATLGPASGSYEMIEQLYHAGVDVFRINMSHGVREDKVALVARIRAAEDKIGRPIGIMVDLQGPKFRIGTFADGEVRLKEGAIFTLDMLAEPGTIRRVQLPHKEILSVLEPGTDVLLDDGRIRLRVEKVLDLAVRARVLVGGKLSNNKGVNVPSIVLPLSALTPKDRTDLDFMLAQDVDWVALSFVQRPEDVAELRKLVAGRAGVLAKIEKPAAIECLDGILEIADAVMVARGDLGVESQFHEVPGLQKTIIRAAREAGKAVVVATQMLESMITSPVPTRAEVSDVANAVYEGADAVMLSAESAVGDHPLAAVRMMERVALQVEGDPDYHRAGPEQRLRTDSTAEDAISAAAQQVARTVRASSIVTFTTSGSTALRAAQKRPDAPILVLTPNLSVARKLSLFWGLHMVKTRDVSSFEEMIAKSKRMALRHGHARQGDRIVITAGVPFGTPGATNVLHIAWVAGDELDGNEDRPED